MKYSSQFKIVTFSKEKQSSKLKGGQAMILGIVFMTVILILAASLFGRTADFLRFGSGFILQEQAIQMAEAGLDWGVWHLNQNAGANPPVAPQSVGTSGEFKVTVVDKTSALKEITSTGYFPNSTNPYAKRTLKAQVFVNSQQVSFKYAAQIGTGGLDMRNSSRINGTAYSNGNIIGSGSSTITGDAYAVGSISSPDPWVQGNKITPASPAPMPINDPTTWYSQRKSEAETGGNNTCPCTYDDGINSLFKGKYNGDMTLQNDAELVIQTGPIWITGNLTVQNTAKIKLDQSFGSNGAIIIIDGKVKTENSGAFEPTSANPKGYILVVTTNTQDDAVLIQNSGVNALFYALEGGATLQNTAQITSLLAKKLIIQNNATLTYDTGLAGATFTSGPGASWQIKKGTYRFSTNP